MATAGRKPKPTALKEMMGNPGRRPLNAREPRPPAARPSPPFFLNARARVEWESVVGRLADIGLMTDLDTSILAAYCVSHARWSQALDDIEVLSAKDPATHGAIIKTTKGNYQQNPLIGVANTAQMMMCSHAAELGMTPSARSRMAVIIPTNPTGDGAGAPDPAANDPQGNAAFFH